MSALPDGTQVVQTPRAIYVVNKDTGASSKVQDLDPADVSRQAVNVGGKVYTFDPSEKDPAKQYTLPPNVQAAATVGNSSSLPELIWYDDQGNEVGRQKNPNYGKAPITSAPTPNTVAPRIQVPESQVKAGGDPSKLVWIDNEGQVTASAALKQLASHLTGQVVDGKISVDDAKTMIDAANARMTAEAQQTQAQTAQATQVGTAASDLLTNAQKAATTGAGMLQQRASTAQSMLQNILGTVSGNKNFMSAPAGIGDQLTQGIAG